MLCLFLNLSFLRFRKLGATAGSNIVLRLPVMQFGFFVFMNCFRNSKKDLVIFQSRISGNGLKQPLEWKEQLWKKL
jgi:hypothetical protein